MIFKVGVFEWNGYLNGILKDFKRSVKTDKRKKIILPPNQEHTRLVGDFLDVHISIFNFKF